LALSSTQPFYSKIGQGSAMTISACITAHNEELNIERTLRSIDWVDEIILVDCESTDRTAEIARYFNSKVYLRPNNLNLNLNKNFGFSKASTEWILCLDADEVIPRNLAEEIKSVVKSNVEENGFFIRRKNNYFGKFLMHGGNHPDKQLRLFRKKFGKFPAKHVHERLEVEGRTGTLSETFEHYPYRDVEQYINKLNFYTTFESNFRLQQGIKFSILRFLMTLLSAFFRFFRRYIFKLGFLDGFQGFAAAFFDFVSQLVIQIKIWESKGNVGNDRK
jgi:glycosyltransferase involved in cell wall biosynthesis